MEEEKSELQAIKEQLESLEETVDNKLDELIDVLKQAYKIPDNPE